jgi:Virus neck protein
MATSQYFSNYSNRGEQRLIEDIIVESIKIMGTDVFYLPNDNDQARDLLYGEDPVKKFETAFPIEIYPSNSTEYGGEKEFFTKFGLEIRNQVSVIMSKRAFSERVPQDKYTRPREGDLIYVPFLNGTGELYEIKFTNQTKDFFMLGRQVPYFYELDLEKFRYSQEAIQTGQPDIDAVVSDSAYTLNLTIGDGNFINFIPKEVVYQSANHLQADATAVALVQSWIPHTHTLTVTNIAGEFVDGIDIIGAKSGAQWTLNMYDPLEAPAVKEVYDNQYISIQGGDITNTSETNPFGKI